LENEVFKGASPKVLKEAGLPDMDKSMFNRLIRSPGKLPLYTRHTEEGVIN